MIRKLIAAGLDQLLQYLGDPEPIVRLEVAQAIGCFPELGPRYLPDLKTALNNETDEFARDTLEEVVERLTN